MFEGMRAALGMPEAPQGAYLPPESIPFASARNMFEEEAPVDKALKGVKETGEYIEGIAEGEGSLANVDYSFLTEVEGFESTGYIPKKGGKIIGQSGVTIASGLDLGQQSVKGLRDMGIPNDLVKRMEPYIGLKTAAAERKLRERPLSITKEEAQLINSKVKPAYVADIEARYNAASSFKFSELPREWQTAITSVAFQYGGNLAKRTPNFWKQITSGDWKGAHANLNNFGDQYTTRRKKEAALVKEFLDWPTSKPKEYIEDQNGTLWVNDNGVLRRPK